MSTDRYDRLTTACMIAAIAAALVFDRSVQLRIPAAVFGAAAAVTAALAYFRQRRAVTDSRPREELVRFLRAAGADRLHRHLPEVGPRDFSGSYFVLVMDSDEQLRVTKVTPVRKRSAVDMMYLWSDQERQPVRSEEEGVSRRVLFELAGTA